MVTIDLEAVDDERADVGFVLARPPTRTHWLHLRGLLGFCGFF